MPGPYPATVSESSDDNDNTMGSSGMDRVIDLTSGSTTSLPPSLTTQPPPFATTVKPSGVTPTPLSTSHVAATSPRVTLARTTVVGGNSPRNGPESTAASIRITPLKPTAQAPTVTSTISSTSSSSSSASVTNRGSPTAGIRVGPSQTSPTTGRRPLSPRLAKGAEVRDAKWCPVCRTLMITPGCGYCGFNGGTRLAPITVSPPAILNKPDSIILAPVPTPTTITVSAIPQPGPVTTSVADTSTSSTSSSTTSTVIGEVVTIVPQQPKVIPPLPTPACDSSSVVEGDLEMWRRELERRGIFEEVPEYVPVEVPITVTGKVTNDHEVEELPFDVEQDVFQEEVVVKEVEEITEIIKEVPFETVVEKVVEVVDLQFVRVPVDTIVECVTERIVEVPIERTVEVFHDVIQEIIERVPVEVTVEKPIEVTIEKIVETVVEVEVCKFVEVPYDRYVSKFVEVPFEKVVEKRVEMPVEKVIETIVEKAVPYYVDKVREVDQIVTREVTVPVERLVEKLVELPRQTIEKEVEVMTYRYGSGATTGAVTGDVGAGGYSTSTSHRQYYSEGDSRIGANTRASAASSSSSSSSMSYSSTSQSTVEYDYKGKQKALYDNNYYGGGPSAGVYSSGGADPRMPKRATVAAAGGKTGFY